MRTIDDMMPILSICHGQGSKMNFLVSDYIRVNTTYLTLYHLCSKGFRITACQSWFNFQIVKDLKVFVGGAVFI